VANIATDAVALQEGRQFLAEKLRQASGIRNAVNEKFSFLI
jgi:hypothetical protein